MMTLGPSQPANSSRAQAFRAALVRLWSPKGMVEKVAQDWPGHATGEAVLLYWRARLLLLVSGWIGLAIVAASFIAWFAGNHNIPAAVVLSGTAIMGLDITILHAFRVWLLFKIGGWSRRKHGPVRRAEQPKRFWIWAAASCTILALFVLGAGYVLWSLISAILGIGL
jgi:hypothetical protein